jgi:hypothetical protein
MSSIRTNPAYFGPSVIHTQYDHRSAVYAVEGERYNLPYIQFEISSPLGRRVFVTYRQGIDGVDVAPNAQP